MKHRIHRTARWVKNHLAPHALILMYHRITVLPSDPHLLTVTPQHFAEHLEVLQQMAHPMRLTELVNELQGDNLPNRSVVITFDDGYADNLHQAGPLLNRWNVPATVFVTARQLGSQQEFWWDELDRILLQTQTLPEHLKLDQNGKSLEWDLGKAAIYDEWDLQQEKFWHVERAKDTNPRHLIFMHFFNQLVSAPEYERQDILQNLRLWASLAADGRPTHRALTPDELLDLAKQDLIEIGAHSMSHPALDSLPISDQLYEIQQSKKVLEAILQCPVTSFAYPTGSYNSKTIAILRSEGFHCACSSRADAVWRGSDLFQLPRLGVRDMDGEAFTHWLKWWLDG